MAQKSSKNFSFIGDNIKKIRMAKNISQAEFANLFELSRASVGAYEEGRSEPKIETIIQIANTFSLSIDVLLKRELTVGEIYSFGLVNEKLNRAHNMVRSGGSKNLSSTISWVREQNMLNYLVQHQNQDFLKSLPEISIPATENKNVRAFDMIGSEMEYHQQGLHHGDILIGRNCDVKELQSLHDKMVVILLKEGIRMRRLNTATSKLTLETDDPNYEPVVFEAENILELWEVMAVYSTYLNPPSLLEERVLKLEKIMKDLNQPSGS